VSADNEVDDAETKADATRLAGQSPVNAIEALENAPLLAEGNTDAIVRHGKLHGRVTVSARRHDDALVPRSVLERVVQQIDECRAESLGLGHQRGQRRRNLDTEIAGGRQAIPNGVDPRGHAGRRGGRSERKLLAGPRAGGEGPGVLREATEGSRL